MTDLDTAFGQVELEIDGVTHKVSCSFDVLMRFERLTGRNALDGTSYQPTTATLVVQLIACALYEDPEAHIKELAPKVTLRHITQVTQLVKAIFGGAEDVQKKSAEVLGNEPPKGQSQPGLTSGAQPSITSE